MDQRKPFDMEAYIQRMQARPCFICEIVAGRLDGNYVIYQDEVFIAFLNKYPTLYGYALVAPVEHREQVTGDFSLDEYLALQRAVYRVAEAVRYIVEAERVYILSLGSQQGNRHVHWHIAPLPFGVPFEQQQLEALSIKDGYLDLPEEEMAALAKRIKAQMIKEYSGNIVIRSNFQIRPAAKSDAATLAEFGARTFAETFGAMNSPEDMAAYLESNYGIAQQTTELEDPNIVTVMIETGDTLVAYAQVRRQAPAHKVKLEKPVELWRFYVDRPWHGRGVAQLLMEQVHAAASELGGEIIWLSVWKRNERAIAYYKKEGFIIAGTKQFQLGNDLQSDYVMAAGVRKPRT
ncbi:MAG TPA: GNAT family N-acetyltransferase [Anaerolineales bacterium]|nr:GNAT family N-acetyltransferase [Anaerolineales bacterium]